MKKIIWICIITLWVLAVIRLGIKFSDIIEGVPRGLDYLSRVFPPDIKYLSRLGPALIETYLIAIVSLSIAVIIALPLSFLGAFTTSPHHLVYHITRMIFNLCRGFPPIFLALLFVSMIGLGPLPAILALVIHNIGTLGKYFSEGAEASEFTTTNDAMRLDGANWVQIIIYGYIPMLKVLYIGYILYYFEFSVRASSYLGLVGAGGIGIYLKETVSLFQYQRIGTIILLIFTMVMVNDLISGQIRRRIKL
jgi:phosphonate transport system permease protein